MIIKWFVYHQWKEMKRSSVWQKNLAVNIFIGFMIFILLIYLLMIGLFIDKILEEINSDVSPVGLFNGFLLYYFGIEFFIRFFMQSLPTLNIESYLHLPVKRSAIVHYVTSKSVFAVGNYLMLLVVTPFAFKVVAPEYSLQAAWIWLAAFMILVFANNFLATYIKRQLVNKPQIVGIFGLILIVLILLDFFHVISVSALSASFFGLFIIHPVWIGFPVFLLMFTYSLNYFFLRARLYPDEVVQKKTEKMDSLSNIRYLKQLGLIGQLIALDLRMIWRHKRTRSILYMAPFFLGYGFFFYPNPEYNDKNGFLIFVGVFMTGGMMMNYLNYCFSYESNYFDNIIVNYRDFEKYIRSKYIFAVGISAVSYVITIPYVFFGAKVLLINSMTFLYNLGFLSFVLFYLATFSKKRMEMTRSATFNYQGLNATHWLSMLPAFLLPVFIYLPFSFAGAPTAGLIFIGAVGLIGLLFHKSLLTIVLKQFNKRKYAMAEGFRE